MNRLLFIAANPWAAWGGSEKLWVYTAKYLLREKSLKTGILIRNWESVDPVLKDLLDASEVFEHQTERSFLHRSLAKVSARFHPDAHRERIFLTAHKRMRPDLVVISQGANWDGLQWMEFCGKHKTPYVTISHVATASLGFDHHVGERLALGLSNARCNYFVSKDNLRITELQVGLRLPNSRVVANPFDVPYDCHLAFPSVKPEFRMACVARFELQAKGQDVLLETLSDPKWKGRNIAVGLYGSGRDRMHIEKLIKLFEVDKLVRIMDFVQPIEIWRTNHALLLPSRYEGLPLALVEAMMCGRFGIVTNVSGNTEVIEDNVNGFVAEAPKAVYLDNALERAWDKREQWEAIGEKARSFIKGKIPPDPVADFAKELLTII
jgi:glycosyltransferase involved in cell wall biosynthesis